MPLAEVNAIHNILLMSTVCQHVTHVVQNMHYLLYTQHSGNLHGHERVLHVYELLGRLALQAAQVLAVQVLLVRLADEVRHRDAPVPG